MDIETKPQPRNRRRSARKDRSAQPGQNTHLRVPYISRKVPTYDLLDEGSLVRIEETADRILAEIGIEVREDAEAVRLYREAGAEVREISSEAWNVRFQPGMVREILKTAPGQFTQHARNPANNLPFGKEHAIFVPMTGAPYLRDLNDERRNPLLEDLANFHKLAHMLPAMHSSAHHIVEPSEWVN